MDSGLEVDMLVYTLSFNHVIAKRTVVIENHVHYLTHDADLYMAIIEPRCEINGVMIGRNGVVIKAFAKSTNIDINSVYLNGMRVYKVLDGAADGMYPVHCLAVHHSFWCAMSKAGKIRNWVGCNSSYEEDYPAMPTRPILV